MTADNKCFISDIIRRAPTAKLFDTLNKRVDTCNELGIPFTPGDLCTMVLAELKSRNPDKFRAWFDKWTANDCTDYPSFYAL